MHPSLSTGDTLPIPTLRRRRCPRRRVLGAGVRRDGGDGAVRCRVALGRFHGAVALGNARRRRRDLPGDLSTPTAPTSASTAPGAPLARALLGSLLGDDTEKGTVGEPAEQHAEARRHVAD